MSSIVCFHYIFIQNLTSIKKCYQKSTMYLLDRQRYMKMIQARVNEHEFGLLVCPGLDLGGVDTHLSRHINYIQFGDGVRRDGEEGGRRGQGVGSMRSLCPQLGSIRSKTFAFNRSSIFFAPTDFQKVRRSWNLLLASQSRTKQYVAISLDDYKILTYVSIDFRLYFLFLKDRRSIQKLPVAVTTSFFLFGLCLF